MGEVKNNFLRSKMNQDLDDRLIPNGEYRNAENISVGKSESSDVGAIEDILGNSLIAITDVVGHDYEIIGVYADISNERLITFLKGSGTTKDAIRMYDLNSTSSYPLLIEGDFLNFNADNRIISINLIEDLLFWTDNFNQPRKINIQRAIGDSGYYKTEHSISVAKYLPFEAINLYKDTEANVLSVVDPLNFTVTKNEKLAVGMTIVNETITAIEYIKIKSVDQTDPSFTAIEIYEAPLIPVVIGDTFYCIISTMTDGTLNGTNTNWPGDPDFLEDKLVRFSYRFKFDDNEYSLFAPFTQIGFIPKQKGYFGVGQEQAAYSSTIVNFFENLINDIKLIVPLPCQGANLNSLYKIKSLDILYKESDALAIRVMDTISSNDIAEVNPLDSFFEYDYQSRKPIKTVPSNQIVRVYDKVPVKAKAQEITGNRVIYGNFQDKHTPPSNLAYNVRAGEKIANQYFPDFVELPNHTLKQNRNYQVGFVLSDKYGRSSSVILSTVDEQGATGSSGFFGGSTVYSPYYTSATDISNGVYNWFGNSLVTQLNQTIASTKSDSTGEPGLYATTIISFAVVNPTINNNTIIPSYTYNFTSTSTTEPIVGTDIPAVGESLRGEFIDYVTITAVTVGGSASNWSVTIETDAEINPGIYLANSLVGTAPDLKYSYTINPLGWYSYKVVVKQTEQDYYNVYLPSVLSGAITGGLADPPATTSYITLINDNINKVPRDLSEVGPDQKQYRSSVRLYGRVENKVTTTPTPTFFNAQFYPLRQASTTDIIAEVFNLVGQTTGHTQDEIYQSQTNPTVARVTSTAPFGIIANDFTPSSADFRLAVYETEPDVSAIDIFWESASSGLISDLNYDVLTGFDGAVGFENFTFTFNETNLVGDTLNSQWFDAVNNVGSAIAADIQSYTVTSGRGNVTGDFIFEKETNPASPNFNKFRILLNSNYEFLNDSPINDVFNFEITLAVGTDVSVLQLGPYSLVNSAPSLANAPSNPYVFDELQDVNTPIATFSPAYNGSSITGGAFNSGNGISWEINFSGPGAGLFTIDSTTGELFVVDPVTTPTGAYYGTLSVWDATLNSVPISGSGAGTDPSKSLKTVYNLQIIKGFPPTGISASELFSVTWNPDTGGYVDSMATATMIYYLTDGPNPSTSLTTTNQSAIAGVSTNFVEYIDDNGVMNISQSRKLSGALNQGEMLIGISGEWDRGSATNQNDGFVSQKVEWRSSPSGSWQVVTDMSGTNLSGTNIGLGVKLGPLPITSAPAPQSFYTAHNVPGEYKITIQIEGDAGTIYQDYPLGDTFKAKITLYDLHYINNGSIKVYGISPQVSIAENGTSTSNPGSGVGSPTDFIYSDNPFPQYASRFYTDVALVTPFTPTITGFCNMNDFYEIPPGSTRRNFAPQLNSDGVVLRPAGPSNTSGTLDASVRFSEPATSVASNKTPIYLVDPI